ncbi:MAG: hypothetical protein OQK44_07380 [Gammaproteobacteria bacterium]|jgi:hypothetical protein|nr:hypothetical protein [Gammaproteobacteria bacterium]
MWKVEYKPNNDSQPWTLLESYDNKASAILHASKVSAEYFRIKVTDPDCTVVWAS